MSDEPHQPELNFIDSSASEMAIVGAVFSDGSLIESLSRDVHSDMFSIKWLGTVWGRMCNLSSQNVPVDLLSFISAASDLAGKIGASRLAQLRESFVGEAQTHYHVERLKEAHFRRTLIRHAESLKLHAADTVSTSVDELHSAVEQIAMGMSETAAAEGLVDGEAEAEAWFNDVKYRNEHPESAYGMLTSWDDLDDLTMGFQRTDLIIVGGYTSIGKSAFSIETMLRVRSKGYKVAVFSLEMSRRQVQHRIAANFSGVRLKRIRSGEMSVDELRRVEQAKRQVADIAIMDVRGLSTDLIAAEMKRRKRTKGLDFVVVDYLQEIKEPPEPNDNAGSAYARVARKLRKAAQQCDCAVMALSQFNRDAAKANAKPTVAMLSGSSGIETAADMIILLHRNKEEEPETLFVNLAKNRNGDTDEVTLHYDLGKQQITGIDGRDTYRELRY